MRWSATSGAGCPDGTLAIFDGPRCLARYDARGTLDESAVPRAAA